MVEMGSMEGRSEGIMVEESRLCQEKQGSMSARKGLGVVMENVE